MSTSFLPILLLYIGGFLLTSALTSLQNRQRLAQISR